MVIREIFNGTDRSQQPNIIKKYKFASDESKTKHVQGIGRIIMHYEPLFLKTELTSKVYRAIFDYFTGHSTTLDLNKGLWIQGKTGSGKSLLFDVFKAYTSEILSCNSFVSVSYKRLVDNYKLQGTKGLIEVSKQDNVSRAKTIYIDDFGSVSSDANHFQNFIDISDYIVDERYRIYQCDKKLFHVSSNKMPHDMSLDGRMIGRIKEMFNLIQLDETNHRNLK